MAWKEFRKGKRAKLDVQAFEYHLEDNIFALHDDLVSGRYRHGRYYQFWITDPKPRLISKARVRDRLLHHAIHRILYPMLDPTFIFDSYSCRNDKGTHKAFARLVAMARKISRNYTGPCWALKLDIRKFFDSVNHITLVALLEVRIADERLMELLKEIIFSFSRFRIESGMTNGGKGIPLGNLTSQLFANVYLDSLDKFVKHRLKARCYLRYADDFIFLANNPDELMGYLVEVSQLLKTSLKLQLHPGKIILRKLKWGIDYVGYVALPHYSIPRRKTIGRITKRVGKLLGQGGRDELTKALPSYLGYLGHVKGYNTTQQLKNLVDGVGC
ncbi:MAG: reverse transcriptase/maturase family protein [bacterium]